jgi:transposase IS116/IS110/IS902 family protein
VQKSVEVALARIAHDDRLLRDMALTIRKTAKQHDANTLSLWRTVPGSGALLSLGLLYAIHAIPRFPRGPDFVSYCRLGTCAKESAGQRYGPSGTKMGNASRTWAFAEATVLFLRANPTGQRSLTRLEKKPSKGKAFTVLAHKLARAVYSRLQRQTAFARPTFCRGSRREVGEPAAALATRGISLRARSGMVYTMASANAQESVGPAPRSLRVDWTPTSAPEPIWRQSARFTGAAPPPSLALTGARNPFSHLVA